ncbi:glycoside hydrolase family 30 protein [Maribellus mangrovi]|uniref:glycoside hydrolase family 30 protein n=1 Tax=Maribellus mangrovi TaxID=3133146 RepID=UPI0030EF8039
MRRSIPVILFLLIGLITHAQKFQWTSSTEGEIWKQTSIQLEKTSNVETSLTVGEDDYIVTFKAWGGTFNEKGWDALNMLPREKQEIILKKLFAPDGDLRYTLGRFSMNANDYARDWYSCDEVPGDFQLKYFNIDRDKTSIIPFIKAAQSYNPELRFWISPWSPPSWMKINQYYSVVSNSEFNELDPKLDYLLFEDVDDKDKSVFPNQVTENDYFIQDPRYLQTYADYFSKYISAYQKEGIDIGMVMFQNEAWSYTPYPGCAWTADGIIRFNVEYLAPTLKKDHPDVKVYLGTINTNRYDIIDEVLSDPRMPKTIQGVGFQWEGGQILPKLREKYPDYKYVQTESECGWGSFDWGAGEHTFNLINHYLGNGCEEYTFWNSILYDNGVSGWGWIQNSLIRVNSETKAVTYTPEYYAVKHYTTSVPSGSVVKTFKSGREDKIPILVVFTPDDKYVVLVGNFTDEEQEVSVKIEGKYLNVKVKAHSFNTFKAL